MLWIAGQLFDEPNAWGFIGVFSSEDRAIAAIHGLHGGFVAPAELNGSTPVENVAWPGSYIPQATAMMQ